MARASQIITEFLAFDVEHFGGMAASWTSILKIAYPHLAQLHLSDILLALLLIGHTGTGKLSSVVACLILLSSMAGLATCPRSFSCDA
jgi:hypothetical protein